MANIATRVAYGDTLIELMKENPNIVVLDADLSGSTNSGKAKTVDPNRFFNVGIAEQNLMGVAAGLAVSHKVVFASSFAMFATARTYDQIRNSIALTNANVKICASHAGITVGEDGATHHALEDITMLRAIPRMKVFNPCDYIETCQVIRAVAAIDGPCYVRLGRSAVEPLHDESYQFEIGKGEILQKGQDIAILATGLEVQESVKAAKILEEKGIKVTVCNFPTIKPIDEDLIVELAKTHKILVSVEEHSVVGGFGSAIAEVLVKKYPHTLTMLGINDVFTTGGKAADLLKKYQLDAQGIADQILNIK